MIFGSAFQRQTGRVTCLLFCFFNRGNEGTFLLTGEPRHRCCIGNSNSVKSSYRVINIYGCCLTHSKRLRWILFYLTLNTTVSRPPEVWPRSEHTTSSQVLSSKGSAWQLIMAINPLVWWRRWQRSRWSRSPHSSQRPEPAVGDGTDTFSVTARAHSMSSRLVKLSEGVICRAPAFWTRKMHPCPSSCTRVLIWKPIWKTSRLIAPSLLDNVCAASVGSWVLDYQDTTTPHMW